MDSGTGLRSGLWRGAVLAAALGALALFMVFVVVEAHGAAIAVFGKPAVDRWALGQGAILPAWLAIASSAANVMVAFIAWYAIRFAKTQAQEANRARVATLYAEIHGIWNAPEFVASRDLIRSLRKEFDEAGQPPAPSLPAYIAARLLALRRQDRRAYNDHTRCLDMLEYLGAACRRDLMDWEMLIEMYGGQISALSECLSRFCAELQRELEGDIYGHAQAVYANSLWLFERNANHTPYIFVPGRAA